MIAVSDAKVSAALSLLAAFVVVVAGFRTWFTPGTDMSLPKWWPRWVLRGALLLLLGAAYFLVRSD